MHSHCLAQYFSSYLQLWSCACINVQTPFQRVTNTGSPLTRFMCARVVDEPTQYTLNRLANTALDHITASRERRANSIARDAVPFCCWTLRNTCDGLLGVRGKTESIYAAGHLSGVIGTAGWQPRVQRATALGRAASQELRGQIATAPEWPLSSEPEVRLHVLTHPLSPPA